MWNTTTLQKAACGKDGHEWRTCLKCGEKDVRTLPKTGEHTFAGREYSAPPQPATAAQVPLYGVRRGKG